MSTTHEVTDGPEALTFYDSLPVIPVRGERAELEELDRAVWEFEACWTEYDRWAEEDIRPRGEGGTTQEIWELNQLTKNRRQALERDGNELVKPLGLMQPLLYLRLDCQSRLIRSPYCVATDGEILELATPRRLSGAFRSWNDIPRRSSWVIKPAVVGGEERGIMMLEVQELADWRGVPNPGKLLGGNHGYESPNWWPRPKVYEERHPVSIHDLIASAMETGS